MCFYDDNYDWIATISESTSIRSESSARCLECNRKIAAGEWRKLINQQEHEECQICEDDEYSPDYICGRADAYDTPEEHAAALETLAEHKHDYGETFTGSICRECCLLLAAIYDLEEKEGCPEHARQPAFGELSEELSHDSDGRYVRHAVAMFPELAAHKMCVEPPC